MYDSHFAILMLLKTQIGYKKFLDGRCTSHVLRTSSFKMGKPPGNRTDQGKKQTDRAAEENQTGFFFIILISSMLSKVTFAKVDFGAVWKK